MATVKFQTFSSSVDTAFWQALGKKKIEEYKLSDESIDIFSHYPCGIHRENVDVPAKMFLENSSFRDEAFGVPKYNFPGVGTLLNTNTIEAFKKLDKNLLMKQAGQKIWDDVVSGRATEQPELLSRFVLITFADLKRHCYFHWFAFPAIVPKGLSVTSPPPVLLKDAFSKEQVDSLLSNYHIFEKSYKEKSLPCPGYCLIKKTKNSLALHSLSEWEALNEEKDDEVLLGFFDPCPLQNHPGWPLRNFLIHAGVRWGIKKICVVCIRDLVKSLNASIVFNITMEGCPTKSDACPRTIGWEKNKKGKMGPRAADLKTLMDPERLAASSVDLNLKLMKWNVMPNLDLEKINQTKCLLLGSGTLGCNVARNLMAWGVRHITMIDNGKVSYSNPVRQSLFTFENSVDARPKAQCAADALKEIFPGVTATGHNLSIPMPGHFVSEAEMKSVHETVDHLHKLIKEHDVTFLLTDSRESRWLPTLMATAENKTVINCALGFDTFLVMRHGVQPEEGQERLGCYFCNDVVAPRDSLTDRTLDQQCTVTRPGLSHIAGAMSSELLMGILAHPKGDKAPPASPDDQDQFLNAETQFGILPHQIRGSLTHFKNRLFIAQSYDRCSACSNLVVEQFKSRGFDFVLEALNNPSYLEDITGLTQLQEKVDLIEWDEDGDDF